MNPIFQRQLDLVPKEIEEMEVAIIGCGGLGSFLALMLVKTGIKELTLIDYDKVEEHNLPTQMFRQRDVGKLKVEALKEQLLEHAPAEINVSISSEKYTNKNKLIADVYFVCVDSMKARQDIFESTRMNFSAKYLVDLRMGGLSYEIYQCDLEDEESKKLYKSTLLDDKDIPNLSCTAKATVFIASLMAGEVVSLYRLYLKNEFKQERLIYNGETKRRIILNEKAEVNVPAPEPALARSLLQQVTESFTDSQIRHMLSLDNHVDAIGYLQRISSAYGLIGTFTPDEAIQIIADIRAVTPDIQGMSDIVWDKFSARELRDVLSRADIIDQFDFYNRLINYYGIEPNNFTSEILTSLYNRYNSQTTGLIVNDWTSLRIISDISDAIKEMHRLRELRGLSEISDLEATRILSTIEADMPLPIGSTSTTTNNIPF